MRFMKPWASIPLASGNLASNREHFAALRMGKMKRALHHPPLISINWISIGFRWFWILALTLDCAHSQQLTRNMTVIFAGWASFAMLVGLLSKQKCSSPWAVWVFGAIDTGLGLAVIFLSGGLTSPLWSALLVGPTCAALIHNVKSALILTGAGLLSAGSLIFLLDGGGFWSLIFWSMYLGPLMLAAAVLGYLAYKIRRQAISQTPIAVQPSSKIQHIDNQQADNILHLAIKLNATLNYNRILVMAIKLSTNALIGKGEIDDQIISVLLMFAGGKLEVAADCGLTNADRLLKLPSKEGLLAEALNSGYPCLTNAPFKDPELQRFAALQFCQQALAIPLSAGLETFGVFVIAHTQEYFFTEDRIELMEIICQQVSIALQNARLYRDLDLEKGRIVHIEEEARRKLARDLHDGPTQSIAALAMRTNFARRLLERDSSAAASELFKIEEIARQTTKEIRNLLFTLRPFILESRGLVAALQQLAQKLGETNNQNIIVEADPDNVINLDMNKQGVLFYIAEEAINNAAKHASAEHIWVRLHSANDLFTLEVEDDGVGFNIGTIDQNYSQRGSLGIVNMRERTELINAILQMRSIEGEGTKITALVPTTKESAERLRHHRHSRQ